MASTHTNPQPDFPDSVRRLAAGSEISPPVPFGPYLLDRLVRRSHMSLLCQGTRAASGEPVAVKICLSADHRERFEREIRLTQRVDMARLITIGARDIGITQNGCPYYATRWIKGPNLGEFLQGDHPAEEKIRAVEELSRIVDVLHQKRIIHRDLKPSNVMVEDGHGVGLTLLDLGLARAEDEDHDLTMTGAHVGGTPGYYPAWSVSWPGLATTFAKQWDVYSLAVILIEALTGVRPKGDGDANFTPEGVRQLLARKLPHDRRFDALLERCLAAAPDKCPASANDFLEELCVCRAVPRHAVRRTAKWTALVAVTSVALLAAGHEVFRDAAPLQYAAALAWLRGQDPTPPDGPPDEPFQDPPNTNIISWTDFVLRLTVTPTGATARVVNHRANGVVVAEHLVPPSGELEIRLPDDKDAQYSLRVFKPNYHVYTQPVDPESGPIIVRLERLRGEIEFRSTEGAVIDLRHAAGEDRSAGPVPAGGKLLVQSLDEGDWRWQIRLADYESESGKVTGLVHGKRQVVDRRLKPLPGRLSIVGHPKMQIWEATTQLGVANEWIPLPAGLHVLKLKRPGFRAETMSVTIPPNRDISREAPVFMPEAGSLQLHVEVPATATKTNPWENSLDMRFVPGPDTSVLFCVWETRVQDFEAFVKETGYDATQGMYSLRQDGWKQRGDSWRSPGFPQGPTHPVVGVSFEDAVAFCAWLTKRERAAGRLPEGWEYRLPTDAEWSAAVGNATYPWGNTYPPPKDAGNYAGQEAADKDWPSNYATIPNWRDAWSRTAPVGSFAPNHLGIHDLGGNAWEWCSDWYRKSMNTEEARKLVPALDEDQVGFARVLRGAGCLCYRANVLASEFRTLDTPGVQAGFGFRAVLVGGLLR